MNLFEIENELKKLKTMPLWGRKQSDEWDQLSNFVYKRPSYEELLQHLIRLNLSEGFNNYTIHRWYNVLSAYGVEQLFCNNPNVLPHHNIRNKLVDFSIKGINFDHKTTVFPKGYSKCFADAKSNPLELIKWLYSAQSKEGRYHTANRLFIVLHSAGGEHWKLRSEFSLLKLLIDEYVSEFEENKLFSLQLNPDYTTYSDIIWFEK